MNAPVATCPCCGQPVAPGALQALRSLRLTPQQKAIVEALAARLGEWMPVARLAGAVYADDADGGPLDSAEVITVQVCKMKRAVRSAGFVIESSHGGRAGGSYRRLVRVSA